ncbi:MAG: hypothetical protein JNJ73_03085 [Hyphomonadaceae bacterium]|nr:hypothetical protein [Hyphomonadaceae bacterium]
MIATAASAEHIHEEVAMSLDNKVFLQTEASPEELQQVLLRATPLHMGEEFNGIKHLTSDAASVGILTRLPHDDRASKCGVEAELYLHISSGRDHREWERLCGFVVAALLHAYEGDLLYIHLGCPALRRKDGRVVLDRKAGIWEPGVEPDQLSMIDMPYEFGELPAL